MPGYVVKLESDQEKTYQGKKRKKKTGKEGLP
jgi:hypothetical protein